MNCTVILASIGAIAEGYVFSSHIRATALKVNKTENFSVDLTKASSLHLVEPQWNPMTEAQALDRVHRIGQCRSVTITRYIVKDSIEEVRHYFFVLIAAITIFVPAFVLIFFLFSMFKGFNKPS
jgi:hypothetical protein